MTDTDLAAILARQTDAILAINTHLDAYTAATTAHLARIEHALGFLAGRFEIAVDRLDALLTRVDRLSDAIITGFTHRDNRLATIDRKLDELDRLVTR
jgi:hypothetical protein